MRTPESVAGTVDRTAPQARPARPEEIRIKVLASPTEGRLFRDRADDDRRVLVDVGRVAGKPELHVLRTPEGRISLIGSHWLEPADTSAPAGLDTAGATEHEEVTR